MKQKVLFCALAALAATAAFAQSTVTITGIMDANYQSTKQPGDQSYSFVGQNGARTTAIKFTGTEDLGGGTQAIFMYAFDPVMFANNNNGLIKVENTTATVVAANGKAQGNGVVANAQTGMVGADEAYVGLNDATMGRIRLGTINSNLFETYAVASQMGTGIGTGYNAGGVIPNITRYESAFRYDTPVYNGFSGGFLRGTGNDSQFGTVGSTGVSTVTVRRPTVTDWSAQYANGPLTAKYAMNKSVATSNESSNPGVTTTYKLLSGKYDAGVAIVSYGTGTYTNDAASSTLDAKINVASVVVPFMGTYRALVQSSYIKYSNGSTSTYNLGEKNKTTGWGVEKDLSKRTFVYLRGERTDLSATAASSFIFQGVPGSTVAWGATNSTRTVTAAGISHQF